MCFCNPVIATAHDQDVFSFYPNNRSCNGFKQYTENWFLKWLWQVLLNDSPGFCQSDCPKLIIEVSKCASLCWLLNCRTNILSSDHWDCRYFILGTKAVPSITCSPSRDAPNELLNRNKPKKSVRIGVIFLRWSGHVIY